MGICLNFAFCRNVNDMSTNRPRRRVKKADISVQLRARAERERSLSKAVTTEFSNTVAEIKNGVLKRITLKPGATINTNVYFEPKFLALDERQRNMLLHTLRAKLARIRRSSIRMQTLHFNNKFLEGDMAKIEHDKGLVKKLAEQFDLVSLELHEIFSSVYFTLVDTNAFGERGLGIGNEWHTTTHSLEHLLSVVREKSGK